MQFNRNFIVLLDLTRLNNQQKSFVELFGASANCKTFPRISEASINASVLMF